MSIIKWLPVDDTARRLAVVVSTILSHSIFRLFVQQGPDLQNICWVACASKPAGHLTGSVMLRVARIPHAGETACRLSDAGDTAVY